ncbi:Endolytic peptidoglycan transglycosylase [Desulfonema limicola]|uniref:Probable endolytic peptidoglycan transglycosylase RlpA n=1 Tax=Desulfonema limicola TaxID=45656 RepID=A0A975B4I6_9BACT|nr:septal ring lytic transglycosylase RlpA family protein [Desulfonema limicola]QTA78653.1 Endolytic peptidoglycan transglycosylase [Desulfonema limicola]
MKNSHFKKDCILVVSFFIKLIIVITFFAGCTSTLSPPMQKPAVKKIKRPRPENKLPDYYSGDQESRPYKVLGKWYRPLAHADGFQQQGIASWYGEDFHGKPTSSGEIYNMYGISAAHKILPLNTYVRVRNLQNGKTIDLRINDRGPFVSGRVIDLSYGAAQQLEIIGPGTAPVEVIALGTPLSNNKGKKKRYKPLDYNKGSFSIQVGAFGDRVNAEKVAGELIGFYKYAKIKPLMAQDKNQTLYRVIVGKCSSLQQAEQYEYLLKNKGFHDAFTIAE